MKLNFDDYKYKINLIELGPLGHILNVYDNTIMYSSKVFTNEDLEQRFIEIKDYLEQYKK